MKAALGLGLAERRLAAAASGFTGADLLVGGNLAWFTGWAPEAFADMPGAAAYVERIRARPAYLRAGRVRRGAVRWARRANEAE